MLRFILCVDHRHTWLPPKHKHHHSLTKSKKSTPTFKLQNKIMFPAHVHSMSALHLLFILTNITQISMDWSGRYRSQIWVIFCISSTQMNDLDIWNHSNATKLTLIKHRAVVIPKWEWGGFQIFHFAPFWSLPGEAAVHLHLHQSRAKSPHWVT